MDGVVNVEGVCPGPLTVKPDGTVSVPWITTRAWKSGDANRARTALATSAPGLTVRVGDGVGVACALLDTLGEGLPLGAEEGTSLGLDSAAEGACDAAVGPVPELQAPMTSDRVVTSPIAVRA